MNCRLIVAGWMCTLLGAFSLARPGISAEPAKPSEELARDRKLLLDYQESPEARAAAAERLPRAGRSVLPDLLGAMKREPNAKTRIAIMNAAIGILRRDKQRYPVELVESLFDADVDVRRLAATYVSFAGTHVFGPLPPEALPLLLKAVTHDDARVRQGAVTAIGFSGAEPKSVLPELKKALQDGNWAVRENAATAVWNMTKQADLVIPAFAALMGNDEPSSNPEDEESRKVIKIGLWMEIEGRVREKPDEVCTELMKAMRSPSEDVRRGAGLLLIAFLKGKDRGLDAKRKTLREELTRLATDPNEQVRALADHVLKSAEKHKAMPNSGQPQRPPSADQPGG